MEKSKEYFANNGKVYVSLNFGFAVRCIETQVLYTIVPKTNSDKKKEDFANQMEELLKSMNYDVKLFTDYLVSPEYTSNRKNIRVKIYDRY